MRKMLAEEKAMLEFVKVCASFVGRESLGYERTGRARITALVRACYDDAAKIYLKQECEEPDPYKIAAAIRRRK